MNSNKEVFKTLEGQLFTWEDWDEMSVMSLQFYRVTLIVPVGEFPIGHKFETAFIDGEKSVLALYDKDNNETKFHLNLSVGDKITE